MLKAGIIGLPNVGKSTLFNAVTRSHKAPAENYPFCTIEPNLGVVSVPDSRLVLKATAFAAGHRERARLQRDIDGHQRLRSEAEECIELFGKEATSST